jgi:hypothetical protein
MLKCTKYNHQKDALQLKNSYKTCYNLSKTSLKVHHT